MSLGRRRLCAIAAAACLLPAPRGVFAQSPPQCPPQALAEASPRTETVLEISVLHGTHERRAGDPRVSDMPELREGRFASYASYVLLSRTELTLSRGGKRQLKLPNARTLETRLEAILPDGSSRLRASIDRPGGTEFLPLLEVKARPGQAFIVAGQSYARGILVLVFKVVR